MAQKQQVRNPLALSARPDLPGRFNEADLFRREWPRMLATFKGIVVPPFEVLIHPSSACNLCCEWCIGDHVPIVQGHILLDASKRSGRLPDLLAVPENMMRVISGIIQYTKTISVGEGDIENSQDFKVENVSFSGLIGEPLMAKRAVVPAMQALIEHGRRVGIFTNGIRMDESTWDTLVRSAYVHVSLDAACGSTYAQLKFGGRPHGLNLFQTALANLSGLIKRRAATPTSPLAINASFILYPDNFLEVYEAAKLLKELGVDNLRIKQDNSGERLLSPEQRVAAEGLLNRIESTLVDRHFSLIRIHKLNDVEEMKRTCSSCQITNLMAAIGSDGELYPCNYHPRPGGVTYGSAITIPFSEVWEGSRRTLLRNDLPSVCPTVCDPYKNRANRLLGTAKAVYEFEGVQKLVEYKEDLIANIPT